MANMVKRACGNVSSWIFLLLDKYRCVSWESTVSSNLRQKVKKKNLFRFGLTLFGYIQKLLHHKSKEKKNVNIKNLRLLNVT